jgi:hypothetical protein
LHIVVSGERRFEFTSALRARCHTIDVCSLKFPIDLVISHINTRSPELILYDRPGEQIPLLIPTVTETPAKPSFDKCISVDEVHAEEVEEQAAEDVIRKRTDVCISD